MFLTIKDLKNRHNMLYCSYLHNNKHIKMAIMKNTLKNLNSNLFIDTSDTELFKFTQEVFTLGEKFPKIYRIIKEDQDARGKLKKHL